VKSYWLQHDEYHGELEIVYEMVVRAESEQEARELAANSAKSEGEEIWMDPARSSCMDLDEVKTSVVIMRQYLGVE
jgi:hypothetical protein